MDQMKVGSFIAEQRKQKGLTQKDLAEQLGLSDKTISKWECGNSMPDPSVMLPLCDLLDINVNELLSGEKLEASEYNRKAEENMVSLIEENNVGRRTKKTDALMTVIGVLLLCVLVAWISISTGGFGALTYTVDIVTALIIVLGNLVILVMLGLLKDFGRAVRCLFGGAEHYGRVQLWRSLTAARTVSAASVILGGAAATLEVAVGMFYAELLEVTGLVVGVSVLALAYGFVVALFLLPVQIKLKLALEEPEYRKTGSGDAPEMAKNKTEG